MTRRKKKHRPGHDSGETTSFYADKRIGGAPVHEGQFDPNTVYIFTDGSCAMTEGVWIGGWAAVLLFRGHSLEISGGQVGATVNAMELAAIHEGLMAVRPGLQTVHVYSDSEYSVNCIVAWYQKWRRDGWISSTGMPIQNREVIQAIQDLREDRMRFSWIKGHQDHPYNDRADALATQARIAEQRKHLGVVVMENGSVVRNPVTIGKITVGRTEKGTDLVLMKGNTTMKLTQEEARAAGYEMVKITAPNGPPYAVDRYPAGLAQAIENTQGYSAPEPEPAVPCPPPRRRFRTGVPEIAS